MGVRSLRKRFPSLAATLPAADLGTFPTPVEEASDFAESLGIPELWLKRDDRSGSRYGGNKVRKLELILGRALKERRQWVVTAGAWGSHHALATAILGQDQGLRVAAVLCPQPTTPHVLENLLCAHGTGAELIPVSTPFAVPPVLAYEALKRRALAIPPGGSSPLGALAFAGALLELAEQIEQGRCPRPERIYVALGSSGTLAGLILGVALADLPIEVIGVRVTALYMANELTVANLATRTARLLNRLTPSAPLLKFGPTSVSVIHDQIGPGYGHATPEGERALLLARRQAALGLDPTYTAKAMAGLIADVARRPPRGPVLFWSTLSSVDLEPLTRDASPVGLHPTLRKLFDE